MVPKGLRTWFVIHFIVDMVFGIPLLLAPGLFFKLMGIPATEMITARMVGAALMGIGIESYLGHNASREVYDAMLNLKLIWSASVIFGLTLSLITGAPAITWLILVTFIVFFAIWAYYKLHLRDLA